MPRFTWGLAVLGSDDPPCRGDDEDWHGGSSVLISETSNEVSPAWPRDSALLLGLVVLVSERIRRAFACVPPLRGLLGANRLSPPNAKLLGCSQHSTAHRSHEIESMGIHSDAGTRVQRVDCKWVSGSGVSVSHQTHEYRRSEQKHLELSQAQEIEAPQASPIICVLLRHPCREQ